MRTKIERFIKQGYAHITDLSPRLEIYGKANNRIMYDPGKDLILSQYELKPENSRNQL